MSYEFRTKARHVELERVEETSVLAPYLLFGPLAVGLVGYASSTRTLTAGAFMGCFAAGLAMWTLAEYGMHRFLLHLLLRRKLFVPVLARHTSALHAYHHERPASEAYVAASMWVAFPISIGNAGLFYLATGSAAVAALLVAGFACGFMLYEWVHYLSHCRKAKNPITRYLKRYHLRHHTLDEGCYGVTTPLWDFVFRTHVSAPARRAPASDAPSALAAGTGDAP